MQDEISTPPACLRLRPKYDLVAGWSAYVLEVEDDDVDFREMLYIARPVVIVKTWRPKRPIPMLIRVRSGRIEWDCEPARVFATRAACDLEARAWNGWMRAAAKRLPLISLSGATRWNMKPKEIRA